MHLCVPCSSVSGMSDEDLGPPLVEESVRYGYSVYGLVVVMAMYLLSAFWIYYCRRVETCVGPTRRKHLTEVILLSTASLSTIAATVCTIILTEGFLNFSPPWLIDHFLPMAIGREILYYSSLTAVYCVLWRRQRIIYTIPALSHLSNKMSRFFSKYFIVNISTSQIIFQGFGVLLSHEGICASDIQCKFTVFFIKETVYSVSNQIPLLCLMVFPLYKHITPQI